ncbi:MAG: hypothetical protein ACXVUE_16975 [Solirubrobacteraceae bacterium]
MKRASGLTAVLAVVLAGCAAGTRTVTTQTANPAPATPAGLTPDLRPVKTGRGPAYRPGAVSGAVARRAPVAGLHCATRHDGVHGAHLELFASGLVLPVPAGIGVAPPQTRRGVYVLDGRCTYAVRTFEPTGVVVIDDGESPRLADLFALWGQPLGAHRLAGFRGPVTAFVDGRPWAGAPGEIPLRRHAEIVLELGPRIPPHRVYRFPPGL